MVYGEDVEGSDGLGKDSNCLVLVGNMSRWKVSGVVVATIPTTLCIFSPTDEPTILITRHKMRAREHN